MLTPTGVTINEFNTAVKNDAPTHIRMTFTDQNIVFTDADFENNGMVITSIMNGETDLVMGRAVMTEVKANIFVSEKTEQLLWEKEFKLEIGMEVNGNTEWITMGYFIGEKPEKINNVMVVAFTAYDRMQKFDIIADSWVASLDFTSGLTVQDIYDSLCTYVGVSNVSGDELPNIMSRNYTVNPIDRTGYTCREMLAYIAEACCCYAKIDNNGNCKMVWYSDQTSYELTGNDEFAVDSSDMNFSAESKTWEDLEAYTWEELEQLTWADIENYQKQLQVKILSVQQTEDDIGVVVPAGSDPNSGLNTYLIVDNPFLTSESDADTAAYITPIYTRLNALGGYLPMMVMCVGNPLVETGDIITVEIYRNTVAMPIFSKTMRINGSCTDEIEATGRITREKLSYTNREKLSIGGRYHKFRNNINELYSELYDPTTGDISIIQQLASTLGFSANGIDIVGNLYVKIRSGGIFDVDSPFFKIDSTNKILQTGNWFLTEDGLKVVNDPSLQNPHYAMLSQFSQTGSVWNTSGFRMDCATYISYTNPPRYDIGSAKFKQETYLDDDMNSYNGIDFSPADSMSVSGAGAGSLGHAKKWAEINGNEIWGNDFIVTGSKQRIRPVNDNSGYVGTSDKAFYEAHINNIYGYLYNPSSRDVKHDIEDLEEKGSVIDKLNPVSFAYNNDQKNKKHYGLIYEDTLEVMPEITTQDDDNKAINYMELIPVLLKETQELRKRVAELEKRVSDLERGDK